MTTIDTITVSPIDTIDTLLAAIRGQPKHKYPYRAFVSTGDRQPYFERSVLLVHRDGRVFFKDPEHGPAVRRLEDGEECFSALGRWLSNVSAVVELHPSHEVTFHTGISRATRRASDYMAAVYAGLRTRMQALDNPAEREAAAALLLRIASMLERRAASEAETRRPAAHWRGVPRLTAEQYWSLRGMFKDPDFIEAVRASIVEGRYDDLALILEQLRPGSIFELVCDNEWLNRVTGGELVRADCGHIEYGTEVMTTHNDDRTYCRRCGEEELVYVTECRSSEVGWYNRDDVYYWESDGEYHLEPEPEPEPEDEDEDDLLQGWSASTAHLAHDRSFTPTWYGDFTMGIELEVEASDYDRRDALEDCDWQFNGASRYAMFKRDGSLDDAKGFEIVTAARRLTDHIEAFKAWEPYDGLRSWAPGNCGMHVHIDSRAFTALTLGKFLQFFNDPANAKFIRSIAGRHPDMDSQAQSYAARIECDSPNPARIKKGAGNSRYRIVNLTNLTCAEQRRLLVETDYDAKGSYSTVELRIFRGTLKKDRLLAQIEFAHASVIFCRVAGMHQLNGRGFLAWLGSVAGQYKHLARWFGVYVPRPTKLRPTPVTASAVQRTTEV